MIIKMCCFYTRKWIICWMLNWTKIKYFSSLWNNNYSTWMLSRSPFYTSTTNRNPSYLGFSFLNSFIFTISFYKSVCSFICNCSNSTCFISCTTSKYYLSIFMCFCLIFSVRSLSLYLALYLH